jgi:hypothetical protein
MTPSEQSSIPAPRFQVSVSREFRREWRGWSPLRPYFGHDGDCTNEHIWFGLEWMEAGYGDAMATLGLNLVIPPRLFWLLDLFRIPGGCRS